MTDSTRDSRSSVDSTRDLLDEWNIAGESVLGSSTLSRVARDGSRVSTSAGSSQTAQAGWEHGTSIELLAGFALDTFPGAWDRPARDPCDGRSSTAGSSIA